MPDFPRPKVEVDYNTVANTVWSWSSRTLTEFKGQPRIDLLGEDASFEAGTGSRKTNIDRLASIEAHIPPVEDTAIFSTTDTYPKTVTIIDTSTISDIVGKVHYVEGYLDLSQLGANESVTVRMSMIIKANGSYKTYAEETYTGTQTIPLLHILTKPGKYGIKIELVMNSAPSANRSFDYQLFVKTVK